MAALGGRECRLDVHGNGTFSITNYPQWSGGTFGSFHTTTGTWQISSVGTYYQYGAKFGSCWGLSFAGSTPRIGSMVLTGPEPPYGLLSVLGDPDSNYTLRFAKKP